MFGRTVQRGSIKTAKHYGIARQLLITALIATVLLVIAWWRYNSELSQAASIPPPIEQRAVISSKPVPPSPQPPTGRVTTPTTTTQLQVNGQTIPVPTNGTVQKTIESPNGNTTVHFSVNSTSNGSNTTSSSTDIQVDSSSNSQVVNDDTQ